MSNQWRNFQNTRKYGLAKLVNIAYSGNQINQSIEKIFSVIFVAINWGVNQYRDNGFNYANYSDE